MIIHSLKSKQVRPGDSIFERLLESLRGRRLNIKNGDIIVVSSKIVSLSENRLQPLSTIAPSRRAKTLGRKYSLPASFVQVVLDEADKVIGGVGGALLTIVSGDATANAGVDRKNAPDDSVVLWPRNPDLSAEKLRQEIHDRFKKNVGVVIVDSRVTPLRLGTIGLAIGCSGFNPLRDFRGQRDIYGRRVMITLQALADGVAAASQLVMGEAGEKTPFALVRGAPVNFGSSSGIKGARLSAKNCLYMSQILRLK